MSQPIQGSSCIITYYYDNIYIEYLLVLYIVINNYLSIHTYVSNNRDDIYLYLYYTFNFSCVNCYENKIRWSLLLDL